jgi:hypothetical protein
MLSLTAAVICSTTAASSLSVGYLGLLIPILSLNPFGNEIRDGIANNLGIVFEQRSQPNAEGFSIGHVVSVLHPFALTSKKIECGIAHCRSPSQRHV